jgi:proteasome lid subunit RPN8/RPN11
MAMHEDEERLADIFAKIARIPEAKLKKALTENNIRDILSNPALLEPTPLEYERIQMLQKFRKLYSLLEYFEQKYTIRTPEDAAAFLRPTLSDRDCEIVVGVMLDRRNAVIKQLTISEGTLGEAKLEPRKIARAAIIYNASAVILAHNHPSGNASPSQLDIDATQQVSDTMSKLGIAVLDHIVIGNPDFTSLRQLGVMPTSPKVNERCGSYGMSHSKMRDSSKRRR